MGEEGHELVFVYGTLRRGASNAHRMEGAEWIRSGAVRGRMYRIDWYPGLVLDAKAGWVIGDLWRVPEATLRALDEFEGVSAGEVEGAEYRRVRVRVLRCEVDPERWAGDEAWAWEWIGPCDEGRKVLSGDWLDQERPRNPPVFTSLGCLSLLFVPVGFGMILSMLAHVLPRMFVWIEEYVPIGPIMGISTPLVAWTLVTWAERRRERGEAFQGVAKALAAIFGAVAGLFALVMFVEWLFKLAA